MKHTRQNLNLYLSVAQGLARIQEKIKRGKASTDLLTARGMTFREWCVELGNQGLKVDGKPFSLLDRPALVPLYDAIPTTPADAFERTLTVMKATQLGLTVWEVLADLYMAIKWEPVTIGMFLPDQTSASYKSEYRFMRMVRSAPTLYQLFREEDEKGKLGRANEGNILTRKVRDSILLFLWTSGKVTTESRPMDIVSLDEVQEMALDSIDKVMARMGDSHIRFAMLLSTANIEFKDIHEWYLRGTQEVWHTYCDGCGKMSDLSDPSGIFPTRSIDYNTGAYPGAELNEYCWVCPECRAWIPNPQVGEYIVQNTKAVDPKHRSFLLPRTISPKITARKIYQDFHHARTGDQKKSFFNRQLARPYIDSEQMPVTLAVCEQAVAAGIARGLRFKDFAAQTYMGIDQMGGFNAVIIKERLADGRQAVVWVEAIYDADPFKKCAEYMDLYGVAVCVVEQLPNVNDARRFANQFPGRVFLAGYADLRDDQMVWGDNQTTSDRRTSAEDRSRYTVTLNQYKCMQTAMHRIRDGHCLFPDPNGRIQEWRDDKTNVPKRGAILRDMIFYHFTKTALVVDVHDEERKARGKVIKLDIDPHFSYANMLCDVAWARSHGTTQLILPSAPDAPGTLAARAVDTATPGSIVKALGLPDLSAKPVANDVICGRCRFRNALSGKCAVNQWTVGPTDKGCQSFSLPPIPGK